MREVGFCIAQPEETGQDRMCPRKEQLEAGVFSKFMEKSSLERVVAARVETYGPDKTEWFESCFPPTLHSMRIDCLAWETVIADIKAADRPFGDDLEIFYNRCLESNRPQKREQAKGGGRGDDGWRLSSTPR